MICQNCLVQLSQDAKFCENCGTKADGYEYPRVELSSSGPMQYKITDLNIARLDLSSVRIDLNKDFSKYVIPASDTYNGNFENTSSQAVINNSPDKNSTMPYVKPQRARVYADTVAAMPALVKQNNENQVQKNLGDNTASVNPAQYQNSRYSNMGNPNMPQMRQNYQQMHTAKRNSPQPQNDKQEIQGIIWFVISVFSMSFLGAPVLSAIISVIVLVNISKLDKSVKVKNVALGISLFVFVISLFSILANSGL